LLRSLTPLYLARVASFVLETATMVSAEVENRVEDLCMAFEHGKPYATQLWGSGRAPEAAPGAQQPERAQREVRREEVRK
jgi:hypothetical protein